MRRVVTRSLTLAAAVGMAVSINIGAAFAQPVSSQPQDVEVMATKSFACSSPKGKNVNLSWERGTITTTIYANNHCSTSMKLQVVLRDATADNAVCWTVPRGKGSNKFQHGLTGRVYSIHKGC